MELARDFPHWIGDLLFDVKTADMVFIVEGERLPAHKAILSSSCEYFRVLLYGNMRESLQDEIVFEDVPLRSFKLVMCYIYTGRLTVEEEDTAKLVEVLSIAHMYGLAKLETSLTEYIRNILSTENVCTIFDKAYSLKLEDLSETCHHSMIQEPEEILKTEAFCDLSEAALCEVLAWDAFCADEMEIFKAVLRWRAKRPCDRIQEEVLKQIRLPLIDVKDLLTTVNDSGLITPELLIDSVKKSLFRAPDRSFRVTLRNDVNLALSSNGAVRGGPKKCWSRTGFWGLPSDTEKWDLYETGYLHIDLSKAFFVNHIKFKICESSCEYFYYVEVSCDNGCWTRVIDYSGYHCSSFQNLYFEPRAVRYIRFFITPTNEQIKDIAIINMKVTHTTKPYKLSHGFFAPEKNVSTRARGAMVVQGQNDHEGLLDVENTADENDSKWTSHVIGSGSIVIKLPHPYTVSSMRMLLKSSDSQAFKYYVETSLDEKTWTRVVDHTTEFCRSWQHITFEARPVLFIKIVGTGSNLNKIFSCSRFECPAPPRNVN